MIKRTILLALYGMTLGLLGGCATPDRINMDFDMKSGQPIPEGLPHPETWVYLGVQTIPGKLQTMAWVKPVAMPPRQSPSVNLSDLALSQGAALLFNSQSKYPYAYTESFEYQDLPRPSMSAQEYLEFFKKQQLRDCPSGSVTPIRVSSTELLLEVKSGGCERFGDQDEIDRFLFGKTDLFHMSYMVKSREMTADQREVGIKAVSSWNLY